MKLRIPISIKITAPLLVVIIMSIGLSGYRIYQASTQRWQSEMDRRLERVATLTAEAVDISLLRQIRQPLDVDNDAYQAVSETLSRAVAMSNIEWIGIYYAKGDYLYYWVDSDASGVGYPFFYATDAHLATLADGQVRPIRYTDEFGSYYGFVAPVVAQTETGEEIVAIVEASLSAEASQLLERDTLSRVMPILLGGIIVAIGATALVMIVVFYRPMRQLHQGASELLKGHFGYIIPKISNDEIGDLATTFNRMSVEIKRLYGQLQAYSHELEDRVRKRTAELREERNRLNTILLNIAEGLVVTRLDGRIELVNPAFAHIVARPEEQLPGQALDSVLPIAELTSLVSDALTMPEQVFTLNISWKGTDTGKPRIYKVVACALVERESATPVVLGAVAILHDITHEAEVDQMKTDFISTVSHELRTPLTSVLGFGKLILKTFERSIAPLMPETDRRAQQATQRVRDNLEIIVSEAERLTRLINDVLDIAKIEAGKVEWHMDNAHIANVIQNAVAATSSLAQSKGLTVDIAPAPAMPQVYIDRDRMIQVVTNLLSNAIKFTDAGGIQISMQPFTLQAGGRTPELPFVAHLRDLPDGPWVAVSVRDTGVGIALENLGKVFEKFKQVGDLMTNRPKGTGLGLTISKEIVEHHGGRIWVDSIIGQGSTFTFVLPARIQQPTLAPLVEGVRAKMEEPCELQPQGLRILVVDDEIHIRELLYQELSEAGYTVLQAADGVEGLAMARTEHPNLVIMDLMMPGISGFDAISALRGDEKTAHIPVMILSVLEDREKGYRLGADAYLTKPINVPEVLATVERLLLRAARGEGHKKVLVIEEDASAVDTITKVFHEKGYDVVSAADSTEGVSKALTERPRFIIVNALVSRMNDYEILRTLKCTRETQSASIVVVTMRDSAEDIDEVLRKGADYYGGPDELEKWVEALVIEMGEKSETGSQEPETENRK